VRSGWPNLASPIRFSLFFVLFIFFLFTVFFITFVLGIQIGSNQFLKFYKTEGFILDFIEKCFDSKEHGRENKSFTLGYKAMVVSCTSLCLLFYVNKQMQT
jgi:hypothetical protein